MKEKQGKKMFSPQINYKNKNQIAFIATQFSFSLFFSPY